MLTAAKNQPAARVSKEEPATTITVRDALDDPRQPKALTRPNVSRYLVHMPGSGGEMVARCLQEMRGVAAEQVVAGDAKQLAALAAAQRDQGANQSQKMVLRMAVPWQFGEEKKRWAVWSEMQYGRFKLAVVRHPLQAWLGLRHRHPELSDDDMPRYLDAYADFAERVYAQGFVTYEGLCRHPILMLRTVCELLDVPYDPAFGKTYLENEQLAGVIGSEAANTMHLSHREPDQSLIDRAWSVPGFARTLDYLGYEDLAG